jgi:hypothetical protein
MSPHDIFTAYSKGGNSSGEAIIKLHLDGCRELFLAMTDTGHSLPRLPQPRSSGRSSRHFLS